MTYGIDELAELGGVTRRTVRYYVQRGLIPAPTGTGRGNHYTEEHLDALLKVVQLQRSGVPLAEICLGGERQAAAPISTTATVHQSAWTRLIVDDGIELHLRGGRGLDSSQLARLAEAVRAIVDEEAG